MIAEPVARYRTWSIPGHVYFGPAFSRLYQRDNLKFMSYSTRYNATVYLWWRHNLYSMSKVLMGLMTADGIQCRFAGRREMTDPSISADPQALFVRVTEPDTGRQAFACIELWDRNDYFARSALERCDVYFKRSFQPVRLGAALSSPR